MRPGDLIGDRFEIDKHVAAGGMGQVFRARDVHSGELVALKVLLGNPALHIARFDHERKALTRLSHPGIVRYVAHGLSAAGEPYLAMEWLEGEDLSCRLARGRLTIEDSIALATRVADALSAAHARDIVHRDLKPSNIFLVDGRLDRVKVLDFGIARVDKATRVTLAGSIVGTLGYMAPEQAGNDQAVDARADVFSLGCVLFECLTGAAAFAADHPMALLTKLVFADPPRLGDMLPGAPATLDALLGRMLAKDPADRPEHGGALAEALVSLGPLAGPGPSAPPRSVLTLDEQRLISVVLVKGNLAPARGALPARQAGHTASEVPTRPGDRTTGDAPTIDPRGDPPTLDRRGDPPALDPRGDAPTIDPRGNAPTLDDARQTKVEQTLREGAASWGGRLEQLRDGSVVVALGGAELVTDQAARAARCALWLRTRVGGRLMALATGRGDRTGRMPAAETIDRAAELLLAAAGDAGNSREDGTVIGGIVIDEVTARLLDAQFDIRKTDREYTLHGEQEPSEGARMLLGKATPCVGRDLELRTLEQLFEECLEEPAARAAVVTGPPGAGKSRLVQEFLRSVRARGEPVSVRTSRGEPHRAGSAFGLLSQILRSACGIHDGEPLEVQRKKLVARVATRIDAGDRQRVAEYLGEIAGTPFPDDDNLPLRVARQDPQFMNEQMRAAFVDFLRAEAATHPVLFVLEDMHWGDRPTVQFLDVALRDLCESRLFVLALARPEVHELFPTLWAERPIQKISLKQLGKKASERLVRHVLGDATERELIDRLVRLSEGNAFYLEELIRAAAEDKQGDLPETVVTMVQSRLGALDDDARRILRAASVFGEVFWAGAVAQLLGAQGPTGTRQRLEELTNRELLYKRKQSRFPGQDEYAFRHALLREGAYTMLTDEDRVLGHRLAGEWLEQHGEQDPLALAEHFERGREGARAGQHYLRAAQLARQGGDSTAVIARAKRALGYDMPDELRMQCLGILCELHYYSMDLQDDALPYAEEVLRVAPHGSGAWSQAMLVKIVSSIQAGNLEEFVMLLEIAGSTSPAPSATTPWAICIAAGIFLLDLLGRTRDAHYLLDELAAVIRAAGEDEPMASVLFHSILAIRMSYAEDDPIKGLAHAEALSRIAAAVGQTRFVELAKTFIGMNRWCLGAVADLEHMLKGVTVSDSDVGLATSYRPFVLAWMLADRGAFEEARSWASHLIEAGRARRVPLDEGRGHWALAEVLRRAGDLAGADTAIQAALGILRTASHLDLPGVLATLAALRLAQGQPTEALAAAEEGLAQYQAIAACGLFRGAFLRLVHAECLDAAGHHEAARAALASARDRLLAISANIGDLDLRRSFLEDVPENRRTLELAPEREGLAEGPAEADLHDARARIRTTSSS